MAATGERSSTFSAPNHTNTMPSRMRSAGRVTGRTASVTDASTVVTARVARPIRGFRSREVVEMLMGLPPKNAPHTGASGEALRDDDEGGRQCLRKPLTGDQSSTPTCALLVAPTPARSGEPGTWRGSRTAAWTTTTTRCETGSTETWAVRPGKR